MKKIFALTLALLTVLTMALISCDNDKTTVTDDEDDEGYVGSLQTSGTGTGTGTTLDLTWVEETEGTYVYVQNCTAVNVRSAMSNDDSAKTGTSLKFGEKVQRIGYNDLWSQIKLSDGTTGYVYTTYVTTEEGSVVYTDVEKTVYCAAETSWNLREYNDASSAANNIVYVAVHGEALKQTGISKNGMWMRFEVEITVKENGTNVKKTVTAYGYNPSKYVSETKPAETTTGTNATTEAATTNA